MNFYIIKASKHTDYKNFIKRKKGSISISYIDLLEKHEKTFGNDPHYSVLEGDLYNLLYNSFEKTQKPTYHSIFYYVNTLDFDIIENVLEISNKYAKKFKVNTTFHLTNLDNVCQNQNGNNHIGINITQKESILQRFLEM